jgi:hypothetical protein
MNWVIRSGFPRPYFLIWSSSMRNFERRSREALGTDEYEQAHRKGRSLPFDDIVSRALDVEPRD